MVDFVAANYTSKIFLVVEGGFLENKDQQDKCCTDKYVTATVVNSNPKYLPLRYG